MTTANRDNNRILVIPDVHEPASHPDALAFTQWLCASWGIDPRRHHIILLGDEIDAHAAGRWPSDPDLDNIGPELERAISRLEAWYDAYPVADVCISNHTWRLFIQAYRAGIPAKAIRTIDEILDAPDGWEWHERVWVYDQPCGPIQFIHGDGFTGMYAAKTAAERHRVNTVLGHTHSHGGTHYLGSNTGTIWGMNAGCLIDVTHPAFAYAKWYANRPTLGAGVIINGVPYFEPMMLNAAGRWEAP